ncbi:RagB/SusD family nutrient uptake outer membrane protein [Carboxylicivirga sp. M1479]|uniref:RagB/SusD family nutrient uptake outer membrane protein n=1 Tax=Carboxylicivirga sp. M1479 TaxID=2594476 RepID=UPI001177826B|nr:RagB/SusD family nutrient uptake outer membrane protein [Carboxylicivirga sp. M1479]TRX71439.1 RagB/SusD family nutrient uptake outer membrane protein [Carboxylicivirga sp. M1479]
MKNILYILLAVFTLTSCEDYLDVKPDKNRQEIEFVSDIDLIFERTFVGYQTAVDFPSITGDVTYYKDAYNMLSSQIPLTAVQESVWKDELSTVTDQTWSQAYEAIWFANYVIGSIDGLEGDATDKSNLKAEAYLIKALKQFNLALKYSLYPSAENKDELGIVIKNETAFGQTTVRASLEETFAQIESDLIEGLTINKARANSWRESDASAAALAARYYLYVHDFVNAKKYAEMALSLHSEMVNLENDIFLVPSFGGNLTGHTAFIGAYAPEFYTCWDSQYKIYYDLNNPYKMASNELLAMYQPEDLRLQYFYSDALLSTFFGLTEDNVLYNRTLQMMTGTDVSEMYMILAECAARNNDMATCMQHVEMVRENRFAAADYTALPIPGTAKEAIELIVDERWREFAFTSLRWYDVKRLNAEGLIDPIILSKDYYEVGETAVDFDTPKVYTLEANSRKYARPIPQEVIILTKGSVKQNTY